MVSSQDRSVEALHLAALPRTINPPGASRSVRQLIEAQPESLGQAISRTRLGPPDRTQVSHPPPHSVRSWRLSATQHCEYLRPPKTPFFERAFGCLVLASRAYVYAYAVTEHNYEDRAEE